MKDVATLSVKAQKINWIWCYRDGFFFFLKILGTEPGGSRMVGSSTSRVLPLRYNPSPLNIFYFVSGVVVHTIITAFGILREEDCWVWSQSSLHGEFKASLNCTVRPFFTIFKFWDKVVLNCPVWPWTWWSSYFSLLNSWNYTHVPTYLVKMIFFSSLTGSCYVGSPGLWSSNWPWIWGSPASPLNPGIIGVC